MSAVNVRYIVDDVDAAIEFYTTHLGFEVAMHPGPGFAALTHDGLRLYLNTPGGGGGAGQSMPDGRTPEPGGWNRFQLEVDGVAARLAELERAGVSLRSDLIEGIGGSKYYLVEDPAGNLVELFEPKK